MNFRKILAVATLSVLVFQNSVVGINSVLAAEAGSVVINEIAWAGSADASGDEWIELYNNSNGAIDLSGWSIVDDGTSMTIESGTIPAKGYFLIEDKESTVENVDADLLMALSLANSGDSLALLDENENEVDVVNSAGGAWFAGNSNTKASMERLDPNGNGDDENNWDDANGGNGSLASGGSEILGTPGSINSVFAGAETSVSITSADTFEIGESVTLTVAIEGAEDLFAYGFDINYDPSLLSFTNVEELDFLSGGGVNTAFNAGLEDGNNGKVVVGNARLNAGTSGVDGSGDLFTITFEVVGDDGQNGQITFGGDSFLSDVEGPILSDLNAIAFVIGEENGGDAPLPVVNLSAENGQDRYSISLNWEAPAVEPDGYIVQRADQSGNFIEIYNGNERTFVDNEGLVIGVQYEYRVFTVLNNQTSAASEITFAESRGLAGDFDRSDRVDGKDIEILARSFGSSVGEEGYNVLADSNYDGLVDGNDLITIGANFALTY